MSVFEGLSLLISTVGTLGSVFIGLRQLKQGAPVAQAAMPAAGVHAVQPHAPQATPPTAYAPPPTAYAAPPQPPATYRPTPPPQGYPPSHQPTVHGAAPVRPATRPRPTSVAAASLLLYLAAALQPVVFLLYYGISYVMDPEAATQDFENAAVADFLGLGAIALFSALLGIFVARGSRVAAWIVWVVALFAVPLCGLVSLGSLLQTYALTDGETAIAGEIAALIIGYFSLVTIAYLIGSILLLTGKARAFFFKRA
jgi:hypothetical protein